ncbi:MAG: right-handed parallel beta-helix repeat-containing protein, partial [Clostridia bacterium]|nr:right-handed parallel beta-helix repeat-containing protein [Clostridia bacterium]
KIVTLCLVACLALSMGAVQVLGADAYDHFSGSGTQADPFLIQSEQDFYNLIDATNDNTDMAKYYVGADGTPKYFKITSDLDMKDYPVKGNGIGVAADWNMLKITSHFDGGEHVVKNLSITTAVNMTGLFGKLEGGTVQNLTLDHFVMTSSSTADVYAGLLASDTRAGGSVRNCSVIHSVLSIPGADGMRVGGLVANNNGMLIAGCTCYDNTYPDFGKKNVTFGSVLGGDVGKAVNCSSDLQPIVGGTAVGQYAAVVNFDVGVCGSLLEGGEEVPATALAELVKHTYKIVPDAGYSYYLAVNGTETQADGDLQFTYQPSDAAVIKVVFVPEGLDSIRVHNIVSVGQGGKVTINGTEYTENGELDDLIINDRLTFTVTPQEGKAIDELSYNGIVLDSDTTSVTVVKDVVLKVTFQDIIAADSALYVAPDGSDDNNGSIDAPFATLEKARDTIRQYRKEGRIPQGGMTVYLREGVYYPTQTFTLSEEDSGTAEKPITYAAYPGEKVSISGGRELDYSLFRPVEGEMKEKLRSKTAQGKVVTASLESLGMTPPGKYPAKDEKYSAPLFLFDGHVMQLSRYPNSKLITDWPICDVLNRGYCTRYPADDYRQGEGLMKVQYFDSVLDSWIHNLEDLIFAGYWAETWYCEYLYATLDQQAHTIEALDSMKYGGAGQYNVGVNNGKGRSFCVYNVYEELDEPGEWYIDRKTGMLYLYPVTDAKNPVLKVTNLDRNIIEMTDVSYVTISDLELTSGRQNAVLINGGTRVKIDNCDINTFEQNGVLMSGGTENGVISSHIHHIGLSALNIDSCGDRNTLTHGNNYLTNSEINDFALLGEYSNGINLSECVGVKVDHNEIYNSSHIGVLFLGSENVIEYNEFHDLVKNSADSGAIYTGRDWRDHGNEIRYNHFYNIGSSMAGGSRPCGFFTDDGSSDSLVYGNVFGPGVEHAQANKVHAGQDNMFYHNLYIDTPNVYYSYMWNNRKWENYILGENVSDEIVASYHKKLIQVNENPLYLAKWPWLGNTSNRATIQNESNTLRENLIIYVNQSPSKNMVAVNSDDPTLVLYG